MMESERPPRLEDLIDIGLFQKLQEELDQIYSFPSAIIDNEGRILTATAWQDTCTKFYRLNEKANEECLKSDKYIQDHLAEADPAVSYRCPHGLVDNAAPIVIDGIHLGNFFTGQLFLEPPDLDFFRAQASAYGFDEEAFLAAVRRVPVWTREKLDKYLAFIQTFTTVLAGMGLRILRERRANERLVETQKALRSSETRFRSVFENSNDAIGISRLGVHVFMNEAYCRLFAFADPSELVRRPIADIIAPGERGRIADFISRRSAGEAVPLHYETVGLRRTGEEFAFEVTVSTYPVDGNTFTIAIIRDVSARRKLEYDLVASVRDKETLLRELYHRTKNNMNVISSYLQLQSMLVKDERFTGLVEDMVFRIRAMALVHQKLYRSRNLTRIHLGDYLGELARSIAEYYRSVDRDIALACDSDDAEVLIDVAIPCGLVVNELVTNSFKHAFAGRRTGSIGLVVRKDGQRIAISVADDGVGVAEGRDLRLSESLGLVTAFELVQKQLKGSISYKGEAGLAWSIAFDDSQYFERVRDVGERKP